MLPQADSVVLSYLSPSPPVSSVEPRLLADPSQDPPTRARQTSH